MSKKYKLLKDLPDVKAGEVFTETSLGWIHCKDYNYPIVVVKNNPDFFEEVKEQDWEIQCFVGNIFNWWRKNDGQFRNQPFDKGMTEEFFLIRPSTYKIHSVRRNVDGEVFTVRDLVSNKHFSECIIVSFEIKKDGDLRVNFCPEQPDSGLYWMKKLPSQSKQPEPESKRIEVTKIQYHGSGKLNQYEFEINEGVITDIQMIRIIRAIESVLNPCTVSPHPDSGLTEEAHWDKARKELWELVEHWQNKFFNLKAKS